MVSGIISGIKSKSFIRMEKNELDLIHLDY